MDAELRWVPADAGQRARWQRWLSPALGVTALYLLVCGMMIFRHVFWTDEAQAWLLARDSRSIGELLWNLRYEGHPPLWHLLLWVVTRFTDNPVWMQVLHLLLAAGSVYIVARYSPLPIAAKLLFPFGYFPLFEYGVISRNYQLVMLLTLAACAVWQRRSRWRALTLGILLALLCLSHVLGVIIAAAFGLVLLLEAGLTAEGRADVHSRPWRFLIGVLLAAGGAAAAVHLLKVPPDDGYAVGWRWTWDVPHAQQTLATLTDGLLRMPPQQVHFWEGRLGTLTTNARLGGSLALLGLLLVLPWWRAVVVFLVGIGGQLTFSYVKFLGGARHHGEIFVVLVAACWLAWGRSPPRTSVPRWRRVWRAAGQIILCLWLAADVYGSVVAYTYAWRVPFTVDRAAADAVAAALQPGDMLVADTEFVVPSIAAYLPGQSFYVPTVKEWRTFITWRRREAWDEAGLSAAQAFARDHQTAVIWVSRRFPRRLPAGVTQIAVFDQSTMEVIQPMEIIGVFRIAKP